jgi:hypothetical protein
MELDEIEAQIRATKEENLLLARQTIAAKKRAKEAEIRIEAANARFAEQVPALDKEISLSLIIQKDGDVIPDPSPINATAYDQATETIHEVKVDLQDLGDVC